jgi:hypothetical protein
MRFLFKSPEQLKARTPLLIAPHAHACAWTLDARVHPRRTWPAGPLHTRLHAGRSHPVRRRGSGDTLQLPGLGRGGRADGAASLAGGSTQPRLPSPPPPPRGRGHCARPPARGTQRRPRRCVHGVCLHHAAAAPLTPPASPPTRGWAHAMQTHSVLDAAALAGGCRKMDAAHVGDLPLSYFLGTLG